MVNKVSTLFEFRQDSGLKKIKADVMAADTATGKFKAGWAGAMATLKANAASGAAVAGAALVAFGAKAVQSFTDGALAAGQFSAATGVSTESASQWISAAGDLGINADLVQKAFQKANKEVAEGGPIMEQYGISVVHAADGSVDANETFLKTIDIVNGIQDPTEKARVAQELFGRSYGDVAELIFQDADKVRAALESTSDQQIFDEDEVRKAREYREAMDRLGDAAQDVAMVVGEAVTPAVTALADAVADVDAKLDDLPKPPGGWGKVLNATVAGLTQGYQGWSKAMAGAAEESGVVRDATELTDAQVQQSIKNLVGFNNTIDENSAAYDNLVESEKAHFSTLEDLNESYDDLYDNSKELEKAQKDHNVELMRLNQSYDRVDGAIEKTTESVEDAAEAARELREEQERQRQAVDELWSANQRLVGGELAVKQAFRDAREAAAEMNTTLKDGEATADEQAAAVDNATESMLGAAESAVEWKVQQAAANGQTLDAKAKAALLKTELEKIVSTLAPGSPLRNALQGYIDDLNAVPRNIDTAIRLRVTGQTVTRGGDIIGVRAIDAGNTGRRAHGGPVSAGDMYQVGEGGKPELLEQNGKHYLIPGDNGRVTPASSGGMDGGGGGGLNVFVDARGAVGLDARQLERTILDTLRRHVRFNGAISGVTG